MQFFQNHDASEFEVDVELRNENENQTFRDFLRSKFMQLKILYNTSRKYVIIFIIVALVMMDFINMSWIIKLSNRLDLIKKESAKETKYETASTKKELRHESVTTETSMITTHQSASTDFDRYPQKTEFNNSLLLLERKSLWLLNLETEYHHNLHDSSNYINAFYFNFKGEPIWFENQSNTTHSLADEYNGLLLPPNLTIKAIADDFSTGNSYALDEEGENLLIFDQNYHYLAVIASDLKNATDLKIDHSTRLVFILANDEILRCNMDGQSLKTLSLRNDINSFALDYNSKNIYSLGKTIIEYSNYEGKARHFFHKLETFNHVTSLTYQNDKLFWMQQDEQSLQHIMYCEVSKVCQTPSKIRVVLQFVSKVIAFPNKSELTTVANSCQQVPSVCDHICILGVNNTYACACDQFHYLENDRKTCKLTVHYLIYFHKNAFRGKFIDNFSSYSNDFTPFLPVYFNYEVDRYHDRIVFGKGSKDFEMFVSDYKNMYSINLRTTERKIIFEMLRDLEITAFIYDSEMKRLYVLLKYFSNYYLTIYNEHMEITSEVDISNSYNSELYSMVILSYNNLLLLSFGRMGEVTPFNILTNQLENNFIIEKRNNIKLLQKNPPDPNSCNINWLSFERNNVTWVYGSRFDDNFTIESTLTLPSILSDVKKGFIYEENLYVADNHSIWRVQKNSSNDADIIFNGTENIYGITSI